MSINFNLWFIEGVINETETIREYQEDVDWVFRAKDVSLVPNEVIAKATELRVSSVYFQDTVPLGISISPCNL